MLKLGEKATTSFPIGKDLFTHEEALKIHVGALEALRMHGRDKLELQRLRILVDAIQTYDSVLEKFEKWMEIETRLVEMGKRTNVVQKAKKNC